MLPLAVAAGAGAMGWAVRGRSSSAFGPSVWHGDRTRKSIALTFDDGPTPSTPKLLAILAKQNVPATFFQCGIQVRRQASIAREILSAGHEIGNHSDTHPNFAMKTPSFILNEIRRAQEAIAEATGQMPQYFRPPYGVRWFGLREAQHQCGLLSVMWTCIGRDWKYNAGQIAGRLIDAASNGAIFCLHDGREVSPDPDIQTTLDAVSFVIPKLIEEGYRFERLSDLLCPTR